METKSHQNPEEKKEGTKYQCPMKCEKEKVYDKPGDCPVCNMHLAPVDNKSSHGHNSCCCS